MNRSTWQRRGPQIAAGIVVAAVAVFAVMVSVGAALAVAALACSALLLGGALVAVEGWRRARARAVHAEAVAAKARESRQADAERLERQVRRLEGERSRQVQLIQRLRQSWQAEREWNRELRGQINRMHVAGRLNRERGRGPSLVPAAGVPP